MRYLLALLLLIPAFGQAPAETPKPAGEPAAAPQAPAEAQPPAAGAQAAPADNAAATGDESFSGSIDLGWRFRTDVAGSMETYRSIVDLNEGPRLFGIDFMFQDPKRRLFDRLAARGSNWGDPYNTAHVDAVKNGIYDFRFDYRNVLYYNALPSFANPFAPGGYNEQARDVHIRNSSFDLDLFPGKRIVPYLSYDHNSQLGNGITTWVQDLANEYPVGTRFRDRTENYRGGVRFELNRFHLTVEQGGTTYKDDDSVSQNALITGNRTAPVFGQTLQLGSLQQAYGIRAHSIYNRALLTANPASWINIYGQFLYSQPKTDVNYADAATGNFAVINQLLFYGRQVDLATGSVSKPHVSGNAGFELRPWKRFRIVESWMTNRFHDAAFANLTEYALLSATATGAPTLSSLPDRLAVNYNQNQTDLFLDVTSKITLRGGYRYVWGDATTRSSPLDPNGFFESGKLNRQVAIAGFNVRPIEKFTVNADYEGSSTTHVYFRTSLYNFHRFRARARYQATNSLSFQANFTLLDNQNPVTAVSYDFRSRNNSFSVNWIPGGGKRFAIVAEYDRSTVRSDINYLDLPFLTPAVSKYRDNAHLATAAIDISPAAVRGMSPKITVGGSLAVNNGSRASRFYQPLARLSLPFGRHFAWNTEWQWYGFNEDMFFYENFRTHIFQTGFRLSR
jgi:hypothetical protein